MLKCIQLPASSHVYEKLRGRWSLGHYWIFLTVIAQVWASCWLKGVKSMNYVDRKTLLGFWYSTDFIHILLISSFLLWLAFGIWLYDKKNYGVSFFCCLAQLIVLIGYEGMMLCGHDPDIVRATVFIANWIVCAVVFIISMLMVIFHERKQDTIAWSLSVLQGLCYLWSFIIYLAQNADWRQGTTFL